MEPRILKNEHEYDIALAEIDKLMSAAPGSPAIDTLELWVHLVEQYEDKVHQVGMPSPLEAIKFRMEQQGLRASDLVPFIGSRSKVSEVLGGKRSLSLAMIRRLHDGLGIPAEVLMQENPMHPAPMYDRMDWARFPLAELFKRGWFDESIRNLSELKERAEEVLGEYLAVCAHDAPASTMLRQHVRSGGKPDEFALWAWKARICHLARMQKIAPFDPDAIDESLIRDTARLSTLTEGPLAAREFIMRSGIHVVIEPALKGTHLDGAAIRIEGTAPIIAMTLRHDRLDNFWFTLCHELAHVLLHLKREERACYVDDLDHESKGRKEREADRAAEDALIPKPRWDAFRNSVPMKKPDLIAFARNVRVHPAIVAGRLRKESGNYMLFSDQLGQKQVRSLFGM